MPGASASPGSPAGSAGPAAGAFRSVDTGVAVAVGMAVVGEAAWISVLAAFLQAAHHEPAWLGLAGYALVAGLGWLAARTLPRRAGPNWPTVTVAIVVLGALVGWLVSPTVRSAVLVGDLGTAVANHFGGWLAGLAVLRGTAHARRSVSQTSLGRLVTIGTPGLAMPILVGGALPEPWRDAFEHQALIGVVVFLVSSTLALALTRMAAVAARGGFDWRRNRAWFLLLAVLVLAVTIGAVPSSSTVGRAIQLTLAALFTPLLLVAAVASVTRVTRRMLAALGLIFVVVVALIVFAPNHPTPTATGTTGQAGGEATNETAFYAGAAIVLGLLAVGSIMFLARQWMRNSLDTAESDVPEERTIDVVQRIDRRPGDPRRRRRWHRSEPEPATAVEAYLALDARLSGLPDLARSSAETPSAHSRRLRALGLGALELDLLAADYELGRWAGIAIGPTETGRAIARWRRLQSILPERARRRQDELRRIALLEAAAAMARPAAPAPDG